MLVPVTIAPRPVGVSPALQKLTTAGEDWWRGNQWPPGDPPRSPTQVAGGWGRTKLAAFPRRSWSPYHLSVAVLGEFVQATAGGLTWTGITLPAVPANPDPELAELLALIEYRPAVMAEALAQADGVVGFWRGVLSFDQASHPSTYDLLHVALRVGEFVAMHYKRKFKRPRPSQLSPALMPAIDPPGHAAYPSGHATESYLVAACLAEVMPVAAADPLLRMAERIARNREVLGVHYPSDSAAGKVLAAEVFKLLKTCPTVVELTTAGRKEWAPRT